MVKNSDINEIRERLEQAQSVAIFAHLRPDGDSIGSVLGLGWALEDAGKKVQFISDDPVPHELQFLFEYCGGENPFTTEPADCDCLITPDISSIDRAGKFFAAHRDIRPDVCIDHHVSNTGFAKLTWLEAESPAASCIIAKLLPQLGLKITTRIASALLCGIVTDTIGFSTSNSNAEVLRVAADMVDKGAQIFSITQKALKSHTYEESLVWKYGIENIHREGKIIWSVLYKADRLKAGFLTDDDANFVNHLANNEDTDVAILFIQCSENDTKVSWRAKPPYDVSLPAVDMGGGGHKPAAGATVYGPIEETIPLVLEKTRKLTLGN